MTSIMKDYYKILGLKGSASDEEIRARWIELVKNCHHDPELGMEFDERVKEINEAYQVLKNPSTRLEYDFQREMDVKIKKFKINKWVPRVALLVVLLILCFIYFENPQLPVDLTSKPTTSIASQKGSVSPAPLKKSEPSESTQAVPRPSDPLPAVEPQKEAAAKESVTDVKVADAEKDLSIGLNGPNEPNKPNNSMTKRPNDSITQLPNNPITHLPNDSSTHRPNNSVTQSLNNSNKISVSMSQQSKVKPVQKKVAPVSTVQTAVRPPEPEPVSFAYPSLSAGEEEVRQFFTNYTNVYAQKDIDAFLGLFSSQALQNKQDGLDEIKRTYRRFFRQSEELDYRMKDLTFEIYQNGVEARANYELDQVLKRRGEKRAWKGDIHWFLIRENGSLKILSLEYQHQETL